MKKGGKKKMYHGINIQYPISQMILSGEKTVETRTYPIPEKYLGKEMLMIETPGKNGKFKARIVAVIKFDSCFKYGSSAQFYADSKRHMVTKNSPWRWNTLAPKWGWQLTVLKRLSRPQLPSKAKGIRYTSNLKLD